MLKVWNCFNFGFQYSNTLVHFIARVGPLHPYMFNACYQGRLDRLSQCRGHGVSVGDHALRSFEKPKQKHVTKGM